MAWFSESPVFAPTCKFSYTRSVAEHFDGGSESRISWSTSVAMIQILQGNFSVNCADYMTWRYNLLPVS